MEPIRRFEKFYIPEPMSGCWLWLGGVSWQGYGKFHLGTTMAAHRAAWALHYGASPSPAIDVLHRCDNPACVNPEHLFLGTHLENMRDKVKKNRQHRPLGARNGQAKLTAAAVAQLRAMREQGAKQGLLAHKFGISQSSVSTIINRRAYADV